MEVFPLSDSGALPEEIKKPSPPPCGCLSERYVCILFFLFSFSQLFFEKGIVIPKISLSLSCD